MKRKKNRERDRLVVKLAKLTTQYLVWNGIVGTVTRYGMDGPGIECRGGEIFRTHPHRSWGPHNLIKKTEPDLFPRGEIVGVWRWPPNPI